MGILVLLLPFEFASHVYVVLSIVAIWHPPFEFFVQYYETVMRRYEIHPFITDIF